MNDFVRQAKDRYSNGQKYASVFRIVELFGVAIAAGLITMYGSEKVIQGEMKQLTKQVAEMVACVDKHVQNYSIHVPHKF